MGRTHATMVLAAACWTLLPGWPALALDSAGADAVKHRASQAFDRLTGSASDRALSATADRSSPGTEHPARYTSETHWIGRGQGDLSKGPIVCQRVSELSARTDLAKQIRVMVKEHMVDRVRDRRGHEPEQDIELTREELVQEYLHDVTIVDRRVDEESKTCHATAVMPRTAVPPASSAQPPQP